MGGTISANAADGQMISLLLDTQAQGHESPADRADDILLDKQAMLQAPLLGAHSRLQLAVRCDGC